MVTSAILAHKININLEAKPADIMASIEGDGSNFFLDFSPSDIAHYTRQGNDLTIELNSGEQVIIRDFFANGLNFNNLILKDDSHLEWVDFSKSLGVAGDHLNELVALYEPIADSGATATLLGVLGAAAGLGGALALANSASHDKNNGNSSDADNGGNAGASNPALPPVSTVTGVEHNGAASNDFVTNNSKITIHGKVSEALGDGEKIQVRIDGGEWADAIYDKATKSWQFENETELKEGEHSVETRVVDKSGEIITSSSSETSITVDTTAPDIGQDFHANSKVGSAASHPIKPGEAINHNQPSFSGKTEPGTKIRLTDENGKIIGETTADKDGNWECTPPEFEPGHHKITITATDEAGNESPPHDFDFTVNPMPTGTAVFEGLGHDTGASDTDLITNDNKTTLKGSYKDLSEGEYIEVRTWRPIEGYWNEWETVEMKDGQWTAKVAHGKSHWEEGNRIVEVRVVNKEGHSKLTDSHDYVIDTITPDMTNIAAKTSIDGSETTAIASGGTTNDTTPTFSGKTEAGATIKLTDENGKLLGTTTADEKGNWEFTSPIMDEGHHKIIITATDIAGNVSKPIDFELTVDTTPKGSVSLSRISNDTGSSATDFVTSEGKQIFYGITSNLQPGEKVQISIDGGEWREVTLDGTNWSCDNSQLELSEGKHAIKTRIIGINGDAKESSSQEIIIDKTPPTADAEIIRVLSNGGHEGEIAGNHITTKDPTFSMRGKTSGEFRGDETVQIRFDNQDIWHDAIRIVDGEWVFSNSPGNGKLIIENGHHSFDVRIIDKAGNIKEGSHYTIDVGHLYHQSAAEATSIDDVTAAGSTHAYFDEPNYVRVNEEGEDKAAHESELTQLQPQGLEELISGHAYEPAAINLDDLLGLTSAEPVAVHENSAISMATDFDGAQLPDMMVTFLPSPLYDEIAGAFEVACQAII